MTIPDPPNDPETTPAPDQQAPAEHYKLQPQQTERSHEPQRMPKNAISTKADKTDSSLLKTWQATLDAGQPAKDPLADPAVAALVAGALGEETATWQSGPSHDTATEATKAAYTVAEQQMKEGEAVAKELAGTAAAARAQDIPTLLNRLLETYSDLGSVFVQLAGAAVAQGRAVAATAPGLGAQPASTVGAPSAAVSGVIAVEVKSSVPVSTRTMVYGALSDAPAAMDFQRIGGGDGLPAPTLAAGPTVLINVPPTAKPGRYNATILDENDGKPAGAVTLIIEDTA